MKHPRRYDEFPPALEEPPAIPKRTLEACGVRHTDQTGAAKDKARHPLTLRSNVKTAGASNRQACNTG